MDKPPQKTADGKQETTPIPPMRITPQEFEQAFAEQESYLSLLPKEGIPDLLKEYAFNSLEDYITAIREKYLNDPKTREKFLNDKTFNNELVNQVKERFIHALNVENMNDASKKLWIEERQEWKEQKEKDFIKIIQIMLNTPASFELTRKFPHNYEHEMADYFSAYKQYVTTAPLDHEQLLSYTNEFIDNLNFKVRLLGLANEIIYKFIDKILQFLITEKLIEKKAGDSSPLMNIPSESINLKKLAVATELGSIDIARTWLNNFLLKPKQPQEMCALWFDLLIKAIEKDKFNDVIFLLNGIDWRFLDRVLDDHHLRFEPQFKNCLLDTLKGPKGLALINFIFKKFEYLNAKFKNPQVNNNNIDLQSLREFMNILLVDAIANVNATPQTIIDWINASYSRFGGDMMPSKQELDHWRGPAKHYDVPRSVETKYAQAVRERQEGVQALRAVIDSKNMNGDVLNKIISLKANYNAADAQGVTILMHAIKNTRTEMVSILLEQQDINKNACDKQGHNALWYARNLDTDLATRNTIIELLQHAGATEGEACAVQ
jgi:hypothetical protein